MEFTFTPAILMGFMLALVRTGAWTATAPPFSSRVIPVQVRVGIAAALALAVAPKIPGASIPTDIGPFMGLVVEQVITGVALGFLTTLLMSALQTAGSLIDLFGSFTISQALDPLSNAQTSIFGRFYGLLATTLLFVINGHLLLIHGFLTSFQAMPLTGPNFHDLAKLFTESFSLFMLASVEIAAPLLAALFLAEVVLGFLAKAAPQMNVMMLSFPFKILVTISLIGFAIPLLPGATQSLVNDILREGTRLMRAT